MSQPARPASLWLALAACVVAILGVAAIWAGLAAMTESHAAWIAPLAAIDAVLLLRLAGWPAGRTRVAMALGVTVLTIVCGNLLVATARIGVAMGLRPVESVGRMSLDLAALYTRANTGGFELTCYALAVVLAWRLAR